MLSLQTDYTTYVKEVDKILSLATSTTVLIPAHQKLVAEIITLRLFDLLVNFIARVPAKLACNAKFVNGTSPVLLTTSRTIQGATHLFKTFNRTSTRNNLVWTKASEIKENVVHVIDQTDNFISIVDRYGSWISEIKKVRNRIAHNNSNSRRHYKTVVTHHYGAELNHITPGTMLTSPRFTPSLLKRHIATAKIFAKDLTKA